MVVDGHVSYHHPDLRLDALPVGVWAHVYVEAATALPAASLHLGSTAGDDDVAAATTGRRLFQGGLAHKRTATKCTAPSLIPTINGNTVRSFSTHGHLSAAQGSSTTVSRSDIRLIQHLDSALGLVRRRLLIGYFPPPSLPQPAARG